MTKNDLRPLGLRFAMWLIKSETGLKISAKGRKKAADSILNGYDNQVVHVPRNKGGDQIRARVYKPTNVAGPLPILVYFHGGGYATGWPERHHAFFARLMAATPCIIIAPAFRLSIEAPYPAGHDDCFDTFIWAQENAESLGGRSDWVGVGGNSSGGGIALSTSLRARDLGGPLPAFQLLMYPMIEDRTNRWTDVPKNKVTWSKNHGVLAWHLLLRDIRSQKTYDIPAYAAPSRATDLSGLPPTISYVGTHDILLNECTELADRLRAAGCDLTFQTFGGLFHAMEDNVPMAPQTQDVHAWLEAAFKRLISKVCTPT